MKKNKGVRGLILIGLVSLVPLVALAQPAVGDVRGGLQTFGGIIETLTTSVVRALVALFATAAMAAFFYGIVQYIWGIREGVEDKIKKGNQFMIYGMVALFVMFSVWGIITYVQGIFKIEGRNTIMIPDVQFQGIRSSTGGAQQNPLNGSVTSPNSGGLDGCTTRGSACTINGVAGTCTQGNASRDFVVYCAPNGGGGGGGASSCSSDTNKTFACSCTNSYQCASGYCDPDGGTCSTTSGAGASNGGYSCDPQDPTCSTGGGGTGAYTCDPQDPTCSNQGAYACDPQDPTCGNQGGSAAPADPAPADESSWWSW